MASTTRGEQEEAVLRVAGGSVRLEILRAEYRRHCFTPHFHDTFTVGLVDRGAVTIGYRGAAHTLRPGALLVIEPGEVHMAHSADGAAWSYRSLYPAASLLAGASGDAADPAPFFGGCVYEDPALAADVGALHRALDGGADPLTQDVMAREVCATLALRYGRGGRDAAEHARGTGARSAREPGAVARMREYLHASVDASVASRVTLADVARAAGMSEFHCIRVFRRATGVPPYAYLDLLRVERAKALLEAGMAISRVAYAAGFSDQSHLTRRFKRVVGVTPGVYVRRAGSIVRAGARRVG
jgi:AraC-like DNA-binding protein/quercetin dioxygenase-like cupin family protein